MSKKIKTARIIFDIFLFLVICCTWFAIRKWFGPFKRGFFCGDQSLQYPYHEQTVSTVMLFSTVLAVPSSVIFAVELFKRVPYTETATGDKINDYRLGYRLRIFCIQIGIYLFGLVLAVTTVEFFKFYIGHWRPHFLTVCQPQLPDGSTCDDPVNFGRYIEEYICSAQNSTKAMLASAMKSFPSGHASLVFYSMLYASMYLQAGCSTRSSKLLKHLLQFIFMLFAWYVALTRLSDYKHNWSDLAAGILLGSILAVCVALFVARFSETSRQVTHVETSHHASSTSATPAASVLPAPTFGTLLHLQHPHAVPHPHQYGRQTYHNFNYVP